MTLLYRPDIDGLRGLAVLAVIAFHAFPSWCNGGFVGVDVFFVISGYLITGLLLAQGSRASLLGFYRRRIHRLFPALAAMLFGCLIVGHLFLLGDEARRLGLHVASGSAFFQNLTLWSESGYFDESSAAKPLLHLWSLAIEEQFYLVFPPLLLALMRRGEARATMACIAAVAAVSFAANVALVGNHGDLAFYSPFTRAWELLAGSLLALANLRPLGRAPAIAGLTLVVVSVFGLGPELGFPGLWALLPVLGAALIIAAGPATWPNRVLLGNAVLTYLGRISYPLYLWHWPVFAFWTIIEADPQASPMVSAILVLASLGLAVATFHLIERQARPITTRRRTSLLVGALGILAVIGGLYATRVLRSRFAETEYSVMVERAMLDRFESAAEHAVSGPVARRTLCWGDSHMGQYLPRLLELAKQTSPRGVESLIRNSAPPIPDTTIPARCLGNSDTLLALLEDPAIDTLVVCGFWSSYFSPGSTFGTEMEGRPVLYGSVEGRDLALDRLAALIAQQVGRGRTVFLVLDNPSGSAYHPRSLIRRGFLEGGFSVEPARQSTAEVEQEQTFCRTRLRAMALRHGAQILDPLPQLSRNGQCLSMWDGEPIYSDANHLRASFVRNHIRFMDVVLDHR